MQRFVTLIAGLCTIMLMCKPSLAAESCDLWVRIPKYDHRSCYQNSGQSCFDFCEGAKIERQPACFRRFELVCTIVNELKEQTPFQQYYLGVPVTELDAIVTFEKAAGKYTIIRRNLYGEIFKQFGSPFVRSPRSSSDLAVKKSSFRIYVLNQLDEIYAPMRDAAAFRRLSLGRELKKNVDINFDTLKREVATYPYFTAEEIAASHKTMEDLRTSNLSMWNTLTTFAPEQVRASRKVYLQSLLSKVQEKIEGLGDPALSESSMIKVGKAFKAAGLNEATCSMDDVDAADAACWNLEKRKSKLTAERLDRAYDTLEQHLLAMIDHVEALAMRTNASSDQPRKTSAFVDMASFLNAAYRSYFEKNSHYHLAQLEAALNLAASELGRHGESVWRALLERSSVPLTTGYPYLKSLEHQPIDLCRNWAAQQAEFKEISVNANKLSHEALTLLESGLDTAKRQRLAEIQVLQQDLGNRMTELAKVLGTQDDRIYQVLWNIDPEGRGISGKFEIEYFEMDSMFWTANDSLDLRQIFPSLENIASLEGSALPRGEGSFSASNGLLKLMIKRSTFSSCSDSASERVRMIIRVNQRDGTIVRIPLETKLSEL